METIFDPTYATLSIGYTMCINEFGETLVQFVLESWCHFRDDCETPLNKTKIDSNKLLEFLNSFNLSMTFTAEKSNKELLFLDILIKRDDVKIWIITYFNPTETLWCLHLSSSHLNPNLCKKKINLL